MFPHTHSFTQHNLPLTVLRPLMLAGANTLTEVGGEVFGFLLLLKVADNTPSRISLLELVFTLNLL